MLQDVKIIGTILHSSILDPYILLLVKETTQNTTLTLISVKDNNMVTHPTFSGDNNVTLK